MPVRDKAVVVVRAVFVEAKVLLNPRQPVIRLIPKLSEMAVQGRLLA